MNIREFQAEVFKEYILNGYFDRWTKEYFKEHELEFDLLIDLAEVGLINTEVSELLEDIRNNITENYGEECDLIEQCSVMTLEIIFEDKIVIVV